MVIEIESCWIVVIFLILPKNHDWEWVLETLGDALIMGEKNANFKYVQTFICYVTSPYLFYVSSHEADLASIVQEQQSVESELGGLCLSTE